MSDHFTTIRVYEKDVETLVERYGKPTHKAVNQALIENCPHPEESRTYVTASLPMPEQDAITSESPRQRVGGFYCGECGKFIFKKMSKGQAESVAS